MTVTTPNMSLILPDVGITIGTTWATYLNAALATVDSHDHSAGKGNKITPAGLNISSDLSFSSNNATTLRSVRFLNTTFTAGGADFACLYAQGNELYFRDGAGNAVQLTQNGSVPVGTLSTLTIKDASLTLQYTADVTRQGRFNVASVPSGSTVTYTMPGVSDVIPGLGQSLTYTGTNTYSANTTFSAATTYSQISTPALPSAGSLKIYPKSDGNFYTLNSTGAENQIGTGAGGGLYAATTFEDGATDGVTTYANTAGVAPVTGTGGSPSTVFAVSSSSPLRGVYSGLYTKDATNRQGEGFALPITLSAIDVSKVIQVSFDWKVASGTYTSGDMGFYVYDITNSALITPSVTALPAGTTSQYTVAFSASTSTSYRLIWHVSTTSASAYTINIDQIQISPSMRPSVSAVGDWIAGTTTITATTTAPTLGTNTQSTYYRRVGDSMEVVYTLSQTSAGTAGSGTYLFSLPVSGLTIDTTKVNVSTASIGTGGSPVGNGIASNTPTATTATAVQTTVVPYNTTQLQIIGATNTVAQLAPVGSTSLALSGAAIYYEFRYIIPITQWSSNITLASTGTPLQFVSNSSTSDANDTTSFTYGAAGSPLPGTLTATRTKRVQLSNAYLAIDDLELFIVPASNTAPIKVGNGLVRNNAGTVIASPLTIQNTTLYGVGIQPVSGSATQIDVIFGQYSYPSGATFAAAGANWATANGNWFVKDRSSIGAAELTPATEFASGTISGYSQWASYTPTLSVPFGTCTGIVGFYRREGDSMRVRAKFITGTVGGGFGSISIPSSYTINSSKLTAGANAASASGTPVGTYTTPNAANLGIMLTAPGSGGSTSLVYISPNNSASNYLTVALNVNNCVLSATTVQIEFLIPIVGWS
jgi:hypothetical protein